MYLTAAVELCCILVADNDMACCRQVTGGGRRGRVFQQPLRGLDSVSLFFDPCSFTYGFI